VVALPAHVHAVVARRTPLVDEQAWSPSSSRRRQRRHLALQIPVEAGARRDQRRLERLDGPRHVVERHRVRLARERRLERRHVLRDAATFYGTTGGPFERQFLRLTRNGFRVKKTVVEPQEFFERFVCTLLHWCRFRDGLSSLQVPEARVPRWVLGTAAFSTCIGSGDHLHYGSRGYHKSSHDLFPPTYLAAIECFFSLGDTARARRMFEHLLSHYVDAAGRFVYLQSEENFAIPNDKEMFSASGSEYGQFLWLLNRLERQLKPVGWLSSYIVQLKSMGQFLLSRLSSSEQTKGKRLVFMCAEADTRDRVHVYLSNNLWFVRGLWGLGELLDRYEGGQSGKVFSDTADALLNDIREVSKQYEEESPYGPLVPFRLGYPALPWTLSNCAVRHDEVSAEQFHSYISTWKKEKVEEQPADGPRQEYVENTYANYRFYPEMLSAMLLDKAAADAIVRMRESRGGDILGMCRFRDWLDDWPRWNHARFLVETDRIDSFLTLYYAHMCHHGSRDVLTYYEQVTLDGKVKAPDCVPSLLLNALMTVWMLCFEPVGERGSLYLCKATPRRWLESGSGFKAEGLMSTAGPVSVDVKNDGSHVHIHLDLPPEAGDRDVYVDVRLPGQLKVQDVASGSQFVHGRVSENRFRLQRSTHGSIDLRLLLGPAG
jgi:hypothetical protein